MLPVWHNDMLGDVLTLFKKQKGHLAIVRDVDSSGPGDPTYIMTGIITLEDIIEEILGVYTVHVLNESLL